MRKLAFILLATLVCGCSDNSLADLVNPLQGTMSESKFSTGNTYPVVATPWGLNFWTPQSRKNGDGWQYVYSDQRIQGFKQTHQPSPWINDYGCLSVMPLSGELKCDESERSATFDRRNEVARPYYYGVQLSSGVKVEMTPTNSGVILRFDFPADRPAYMVVDLFNGEGKIDVDCSKNEIFGSSNYYAKNSSAKLPDDFATHFVMTSDTPIEDWGRETVDGNACGWVRFDTKSSRMVELKIASSFISTSQAWSNFRQELADHNFESAKLSAKRCWEESLASMRVKGGSKEQLRTFYTALYRTMLFPRRLYEIADDGKTVHYDFYNGGTKEGYMYGDNGFWDTFRSVHPLFTIIRPSLSGEIASSLLNIYREGGWLPEWFSPAYKDCMIGQHSVSVVTDAHLKGIGNYDTALMFEAFLKGANAEGPNATGRRGFDDYNRLGYVPYDNGVIESVSRTLEYAYNDYCISLYAESIGCYKQAELYRRRAMNYRNVFDQSINFVRPKSKTGEWQSDWTPDTWGGSFTEGSSWHWTWCVYHDPQGLIDLMGGDEAFIAKIDSVFTEPPTFRSSYYKGEIHEMTEMVAGNMGQYAHGNQPIQHMIYLYNYAGVPYKAQQHLREVMQRMYHSGIDDGRGLCGDEDNGQTSAWYVFSAAGFYPVCPGSLEYVIGSPLFKKTEFNLENGKKFTVKAIGNSDKNIYIQSARLNGRPYNCSYITHNDIMRGGVLELKMGSQPALGWGADDDSRPHSMSGQK
ncbi:MAG: GH92 family glycosyl hydrolase [Tidjanibacter sp.]|nr:GH92 family glycosyl hydrolase [Tidjanibacter sp.]